MNSSISPNMDSTERDPLLLVHDDHQDPRIRSIDINRDDDGNDHSDHDDGATSTLARMRTTAMNASSSSHTHSRQNLFLLAALDVLLHAAVFLVLGCFFQGGSPASGLPGTLPNPTHPPPLLNDRYRAYLVQMIVDYRFLGSIADVLLFGPLLRAVSTVGGTLLAIALTRRHVIAVDTACCMLRTLLTTIGVLTTALALVKWMWLLALGDRRVREDCIALEPVLLLNLSLFFAVLFAVVQTIGGGSSASAVVKSCSRDTCSTRESECDERDEVRATPRSASIRWMVGLLHEELLLVVIGCFSLVVSSAANLMVPFYIGKIVDVFNSGAGKDTVVDTRMATLGSIVLLLLAVFFAGATFTWIRGFVFTLMGHRVVRRLRTNVFAAIVRQDMDFFDATKVGELTSRLSSDTQVIQNTVTVNVSMFLRLTVNIVGGILVLIGMSWKLALLMFSTIPLVLVGAAVYGRAMKRLQRRFQDQLAAATSIADETLSNMRTIRACSREQWAVSQYAMNIAQAYETGRRLSWAFGVFAGVVLFLSQGAMLLVIWFGGVLVIRGELTTGALSSFVIYTLQVSVSLGFLLGLYGDLMQAVGASARIFALLHRRPAIVTQADAVRPDTLEGRVELRNVRFQYPSRPEVDVLHGMSFSLIPGKVVALVSPSGGGKSTIVSLLERFYDLPEDECDTRSGRLNSLDKLTSDGDAPGIFIDGIDIRDLDLAWLRRNVALVAQEPALFALSIRDNITFGMDPAEAAQVTDTELVAVAREANAHDFVMTFPDGYDTMCGERGVGLSGGQRQRIAIARALMTRARILLLDEATSALDSESERVVQQAIERAMRGRTVLCIAHRLSTVRHAARVVVLDRGRVVEQGTHDELVREEGLYRRLVEGQLL